MCGIVGKLCFDPQQVVAVPLIRRMANTLLHRGPDDDGVWVNGPIGLGSRRLAIIDLSPRAHMPMSNEDGTLWIVLNGEIYNFQELRTDLERKGHQFRSASDTEVVLHLYEEEGSDCLQRLRGMFAFALWGDEKQQILFLARDRLGKKPLYYYHDSNVFLFASEPKAILQDPQVRAEPNPEAIHHYLTYSYIPGRFRFQEGINCRQHTTWLCIREMCVSSATGLCTIGLNATVQKPSWGKNF